MNAPIIDEAARVFVDPKSYADEPRLHAALTHLRAHAPVSLVDSRPYRSFWAITKHADDMARQQLDAGMGLRRSPVACRH